MNLINSNNFSIVSYIAINYKLKKLKGGKNYELW